MARTKLTTTANDLNADDGGVLFSVVQGEQLEYPVVLEFITSTPDNYQLEAVVVEGQNTGDGEKPTTIEVAGDQLQLTNGSGIRIPTHRGTWNAGTAYNTEDVVDYNNTSYKLSFGTARVDATTPDVDPEWVEHDKRTIYIQIPATLSVTPAYTVQPSVDLPIYGFFELRVTDINNTIYVQTWKPTRGLVEILFSPTHLVPDV